MASVITETGGECPAGALRRLDANYDDQLYADLAAARREQPVFYSAETRHWIVTRYADVTRVLRDNKSFSARNATTRVTPMHADAEAILLTGGFASGPPPASTDAPAHSRIRRAANAVFNLRTVAALEADVRTIVDDLMALMPQKGIFDLREHFTFELPARVIFRVLGIPASDMEQVKRWSANRTNIDFSPSTYDQQVEGAHNLVEFWHYCVALVRDRMQHPKDDFASHLLAFRNGDDAILTLNEIDTLTYGIAFAGHETTTNQLGNGFRELLSHRDQWDALVADPDLAEQATEEIFRYCGAVIGWRRTTLTDVELGGVHIPAGEKLVLSFASANRDEAEFPDGERFDITRRNAKKHLTMGQGAHFCLGAPLARMELRIVLQEFARRYPHMRLAETVPPRHASTFVFRAPDKIWVEVAL